MFLIIKQQIVCDLLFSAIKELITFSKGEKRNNILFLTHIGRNFVYNIYLNLKIHNYKNVPLPKY